jgi:hypothetical protein
MKRDMDESVNIEADPEDALRVLLDSPPLDPDENASDENVEQE